MAEFRVLYARGKVEQLTMSGRLEEIQVPTGQGHIFKMVREPKTGKLELSLMSMCGQAQWNCVGKDPFTRASAVATLPMCPACAEAFKKDPASPWARFTQVKA